MKKTSELTALICDNGLFVEMAVTLAKTYKKVYYTVPWISAFPKMNLGLIGYGLEGVNVVTDVFGPHFDEVDLFIFPDCYFGPLQLHLVSLGKKVWGARMGEKMELDRVWMKEEMRKAGLKVGPYEVVHGMDALRKYLKSHKNVHVKVSKWRGQFETFKSPDYKFVEPKLDEVEHMLGAFKYITDFVVEDDLPDRFEYGIDAYTINGQFPTKTFGGIEIKDEGLVGVFKPYADLPEPVRAFDKAVTPLLKEFGYSGFYSAEVRIGKDKTGIMIDQCARAASPPSELYQAFYLNLPDIIWQGANGVCIDPKPAGKYGAEALIHSTFADKNWLPLDFPEEMRPYIKLRNAVFINGRYYAVPQATGLPEVGAVVGWGNTLEEAVNMVKKIAETVKGFYVEVKVDAFDRANEEIEKMEEFGFKIF